MGPELTAPPFATRPMVAILSESEDLQAGLDESVSREWDRYWAYFVMQRFSWQRFANWWASRRWIEPRDVRRR